MIIFIKIENILKNFFFLFVLSLLNISLAPAQPFNELINKILIDDENINSSKFLVKKAKNDLSSTYSIYTPKLDFTLPLGNEKLINNNSADTHLDFYELNAKVTQNIYDFGATSSKIEKAKNQLKLSQISENNVKSNKIYEAIASYLNYMKSYKILDYAKNSEERIKEVTKLENEKVARGAGLASNVLQSKARLAGAKSTRVKFQGDLSIATNRFYNVFRELPQKFSTFKYPKLPLELLPENEESAIQIAKRNNISLNLSTLNLKNTQSSIKSSKAKFYPSIKAVAEYKNKKNSSGLEGTEIDQIYKLEMNYPISIGGPYGLFYKESADYKSSINQYMIAKYGHDKMERNLEESIRNAWQTKEIAKQNYEYLDNQANISGEFFDLAMKEVKLGNRQLIDILSSETAFINAKSAAESAKTDFQLAVYQLLLSIGILEEEIFRNDEKKKESKVNTKINKIVNKSSDKNKQMKEKIYNKIDKETVKIQNEVKKKQDHKRKINIQQSTKPIVLKKPTPIISLDENIDLQINKKADLSEISSKNNKESKTAILQEKQNRIVKQEKNEDEILYKIQLGAFSSLSNANKLLKNILEADFDNIILNLETDAERDLYKIRSIESFLKEKAKQVCEQFTSSFFKCIVVKI